MGRKQAGFSLIESLLALLVLSIGLLGLGQLQARLTAAGSELHTAAAAHLLGANLLEAARLPWLAEGATRVSPPPAQADIRADVRQYNSPATNGFLSTTEVTLHWRTPAGKHSLSLASSGDPRLDPKDTRWLLLPP